MRRLLLFVALLLCACGAGFTQTVLDDDDSTGGLFDDDDATSDDDDAVDDDDTTGDDDDAVDDDDATADDDDATADDDDDSTPDFEGDEPGECDDGADNDQDGLFDCEDPICFGPPACQAADDAATADDDDATADDDDATGGTAPVIVNLIDSWDASTGQFEFQIAVTDSDCNLGNPTILWSWNGVSQTPQVLGGAPLGCLGTIYFWVGGVPGSTVTATFQVLDSLGEFSNIWSVTSTAN